MLLTEALYFIQKLVVILAYQTLNFVKAQHCILHKFVPLSPFNKYTATGLISTPGYHICQFRKYKIIYIYYSQTVK